MEHKLKCSKFVTRRKQVNFEKLQFFSIFSNPLIFYA